MVSPSGSIRETVRVTSISRSSGGIYSYLDEADISRLLAEALTADVESVLADQTGLVGADAATQKKDDMVSLSLSLFLSPCRLFPSCSQVCLLLLLCSLSLPGGSVIGCGLLLTRHGSPCRRSWGASSRRFRET